MAPSSARPGAAGWHGACTRPEGQGTDEVIRGGGDGDAERRGEGRAMSTRVLLIEDAKDTISLISSILEEEDYSLTVAADGEEGLMAARAERPDLILLDMSLPRLSGWDLAPRLRAEAVDIPS